MITSKFSLAETTDQSQTGGRLPKTLCTDAGLPPSCSPIGWIVRLGLTPFYYNLASLLLHVVNSLLVFALGLWRPVGWRVAGLAACFFAVSQRHSEAVVWFAAVPELLVFFFVLASFLFWVRWLEAHSAPLLLYGGAFGCYILALLSKESAVAVVPLCALAVLAHPARPLRKLWGLTPFAVLALAYFALDYVARRTHLHFNDGTFSLKAPFVETLVRSLGGLLWVWGAASLLILFRKAARPWRTVVILAAAWMVLTLLPYSFLTYMPRVPSRHTYLASVGLSLIVAVGLLAFRQYARRRNQVWLVPVAVCLVVLHQVGYLWTVKHRQYSERARPTEDLITCCRQDRQRDSRQVLPIHARLWRISLCNSGWARMPARLSFSARSAARHPDAIDFCNANADGVHY